MGGGCGVGAEGGPMLCQISAITIEPHGIDS